MAELIHYLHQQKEDNLSVVNHYGYEQAEKVCRFHSSFPEYTVTPLVRLENLAKLFGVKDIYVKDESYRFGLREQSLRVWRQSGISKPKHILRMSTMTILCVWQEK